jgi:hypothetical protein
VENKLTPGCTIAHALQSRNDMSIEFLRLMMETCPHYPDAWTKAEGADYTSMMLGE